MADSEVNDTITTCFVRYQLHTIGTRSSMLIEAHILERSAFAYCDLVVILRCCFIVSIEYEQRVTNSVLITEKQTLFMYRTSLYGITVDIKSGFVLNILELTDLNRTDCFNQIVHVNLIHMDTIQRVLIGILSIECDTDRLACILGEINSQLGRSSRDIGKNIITDAVLIMSIRLVVGCLIVPDNSILLFPGLTVILTDDYHELVIPSFVPMIVNGDRISRGVMRQCSLKCQLCILLLDRNRRTYQPVLLVIGLRLIGAGDRIRRVSRSSIT